MAMVMVMVMALAMAMAMVMVMALVMAMALAMALAQALAMALAITLAMAMALALVLAMAIVTDRRMKVDKQLIRQIKKQMEKLEWTRYRLSKEADIPNSTLRDLLAKRNTTLIMLDKISKALGVELWRLFKEASEDDR